MQAVILVGGAGTRVKPASLSRPKPLIDICGKPFLYYLIKQLEEAGFSNVLLLSGYLSQEFDRFVADYSKDFNLNLINHATDADLNTGARVLQSVELISNRFLLLYGDNYLPFCLSWYVKTHWESKQNFICAYDNNDSYSKSNITISDNDNLCIGYKDSNSRRTPSLTDIGYFLLNKHDFANMKFDEDLHLGSDILKPLVKNKKLPINIIYQRYYSVGTMNRILGFRYFISNQKKKYLLLDRDGIINEKPDKGKYVGDYHEFNWKEGTIPALKKLKSYNFDFVIITNQAGVARNMISEKKLDLLHNQICRKSREVKAELNYIYVCPHHWDEKCHCRKPEAGLLRDAAFDLGFDLSKVIFIGDSISDFQASEKVGSKFINLGPAQSLENFVQEIEDYYNDYY